MKPFKDDTALVFVVPANVVEMVDAIRSKASLTYLDHQKSREQCERELLIMKLSELANASSTFPVVPHVRATVDKASGLHELWLMSADDVLAGPEPWPEGWADIRSRFKN